MRSPARRRHCGDGAQQPEAPRRRRRCRCRCVDCAQQPEEEKVELGCSRWQLDLPCDLVRSVAERLSGVDDFLRLGAVCRTWSEGLTGFRPALRAHFPWLVSTAKITSKEVAAAALPMYSPSNHRVNRFPGVLPTPLPGGGGGGGVSKVVGCHHGWLVSVDYDSLDFHVFNPVTGDRANLPSFSTLNINVDNASKIFFKKVALSSTPSSSSSGVVVAAVLYCFKDVFAIAFAKVGDRTWSGRIELPYFFVTDVIYYQGNFFVINNVGHYNIIDPVSKLVVASSQIPLVFCRRGCYFVFVLSPSSGHLLAVEVLSTSNNNGCLIIKYNNPAPPSSSSSSSPWVEIKDLGDEALFFGHGHAMLLPAAATADGISIIRNCVYHTHWRTDLGKGVSQDLDHRVSPKDSSSWSTLIDNSCCWFLPSMQQTPQDLLVVQLAKPNLD